MLGVVLLVWWQWCWPWGLAPGGVPRRRVDVAALLAVLAGR
ncbi:MAG: hypothetical protein R3F59_01915 [Myxococcota bacterium]